ncbi:MAG: hypothetical protein E6Q50_12360 [Lysobacter sp.]|nr:MAG: hypothetical protein E6Q50_12360 [Lysobacter sp.]
MSNNEIQIRTLPHRGEIENGEWRLLTPTAVDELRRIRRNPKTLTEVRTRRQRQQGLTALMIRGAPFANALIDGHPAKVLTWLDATGEEHTYALIAVDDPKTGATTGKSGVPAHPRTRLIRIIQDRQGNVSYTYDIFDAIDSHFIGIVSGLGILAVIAQKISSYGKRMRSAVTGAVELTDLATASNQIARAVRNEPVIVGSNVVRWVSAGRILSRLVKVGGVIAGLVMIAQALFKDLLSRMTVSIEVMNVTDDDYEWTISEIDPGSVWLNKPDDHQDGQWTLLPGIDRDGEPLPGMQGSYDSIGSVEIGIANSDWDVSPNTTRLCLSIRRRNSDAPPFVFLFSMPPGSANTMAIETGTVGAGFFKAHRKGMQDALSVRRDLVIDGLPVSLEATTDRNTGETSYAELRGRNYTVNVMIGARRYRILTSDATMAMDLSDDGTHVVQRPVDLSASTQEWMLMARSAGHEIIHRETRKALTVSYAADGSTRLTLEPRRAKATGEPLTDPMEAGRALEWMGQAFLIRDVFGDRTPVLSLAAAGALDVSGGSTEPGAPIILWGPHFGPNQMFRFEEIY